MNNQEIKMPSSNITFMLQFIRYNMKDIKI